MALIESAAIHVRNVIEFLYPRSVRKTDVVASDFLSAGEWNRVRPPISESVSDARDRANVQIAHLTTSRVAGAPPKKAWDFPGLAGELQPVLRRFATQASRDWLAENVIAMLIKKGS